MRETEERPAENLDDALGWIENFKEARGRPLRVLHIGNVANNAYNNTKLLNRAGLDCDVICYDYYHMMSCPEWEDADFEGDIDNHLFPDWRSIRLNGFKRPRWFVQGRWDFCIRYLMARRDGRRLRAWLWWNILETDRFLRFSRRGVPIRRRLLVFRWFVNATRIFVHTIRVCPGATCNRIVTTTHICVHGMEKYIHAIGDCGGSINGYSLRIRNWALAFRNKRYPFGMAVFYSLSTIYSVFCLFFYVPLSVLWIPIWLSHWLRDGYQRVRVQGFHFRLPLHRQIGELAGKWRDRTLSVGPFRRVSHAWHRAWTERARPQFSFDEIVGQLVQKWMDRFPDRKDRFSPEDIEGYRPVILLWRSLFARYDIVLGYSTDPILPLLAGKPYFAFEHGTLREIPFRETVQGRLTALSYSLAEHVFVTNVDCMPNARILARDRISFINHPYDEDHGLCSDGWQELRQKLSLLLDSDFIFFFPTRHDWIPGTGYADKGNDIFLHAFCKLRREGLRIGMVCCLWGSNIRQSKALLKKNDFSQYVSWVHPMGIVKFERMVKASDLVVDQFEAGSFGGIVFKAMAVGSPICTYLDEDAMRDLYGEVPPVINCRNKNEIVREVKKAIEDPILLGDLSKASRAWVKKYHGSSETVRIQLATYRDYIDGNHREGANRKKGRMDLSGKTKRESSRVEEKNTQGIGPVI